MLGKVFALCTDEEQALFLNEAGLRFHLACRSVVAGEEMQLWRISEKLNDNGRRFIKRLAEMLEPVVVRQ